MAETPLRVAVLGAGYFAQFHLEAWQRTPGATLVAVADLAPHARAGHGVPDYPTLADMLAATRPDVLDIAVPPDAHFPAIQTAVEAGTRAILCQKPFCGDLETARQAVREAASAGARLIVHENFRFQPWYRAAKAAMAAGRLGDVHQVTFRLRTGDGQGPRAYLDRQPYFQTMPRFLIHETGVHLFDVFQYLLGPVAWVQADLRRLNPAVSGEDAGHVLFGHDAGARSLFDGNRHLDHRAENCRLTLGEALIEGTEGVLQLSGDGALRLRGFREAGEETLLAPRDWPGFAGDCVAAFQAHAIAALRQDVAAETEGGAYLRVLALEEATYASAASGRRVVLEPPGSHPA